MSDRPHTQVLGVGCFTVRTLSGLSAINEQDGPKQGERMITGKQFLPFRSLGSATLSTTCSLGKSRVALYFENGSGPA
jgi:hypothetical protein